MTAIPLNIRVLNAIKTFEFDSTYPRTRLLHRGGILLILVTVANVERSFNKVKLIETYSRRYVPTKIIDFHDVIENFARR